MPAVLPNLEQEKSLHRQGALFVIGCDEVGRGAIAGPVAVGMAVVKAGMPPHPVGLRDSKLLSEKRRDEIAPFASSWALFSAVGLSTAEEIDEFGIMASLGMAGRRALIGLHESGASIRDSVVLLDGSFDWLSPALRTPVPVTTQVKADRDCASVAAASVISKVHRDQIMIEVDADYPGYGWRANKGYGSAAHFAAVDALGVTALHRRSWLHGRGIGTDGSPSPGAGERGTSAAMPSFTD